VVSQREGTRAVRVAAAYLNAQVPLHACAPGWLHLATLSEAALEDYITQRAGPPPGIDAADAFRMKILELRDAGYAADDGGLDPNISCCAALIRNHAGLPAGVLSLSIPRSRFANQPRAFRTITLDAASQISSVLGFVSDQEDMTRPLRSFG